MTAIAKLRFQTLFGERPFAGADRSLDWKSATDAFGSIAGPHEGPLTSTRSGGSGALNLPGGDRPLQLRCTRPPALAACRACRHVVRWVFLGTAPSTTNQLVRGLELECLMPGIVQPGQQIGLFKDALRWLGDRLHYLNHANIRSGSTRGPTCAASAASRTRKALFRLSDLQSSAPLISTVLATEPERGRGRAFERGGWALATADGQIGSPAEPGSSGRILGTNSGQQGVWRGRLACRCALVDPVIPLLRRFESNRAYQTRLK